MPIYKKLYHLKLKISAERSYFLKLNFWKLCFAQVELERDVEFRRGVRPACLPFDYVGKDLTTLDSEVTIVGWGAAAFGEAPVTAQKEVTSVPWNVTYLLLLLQLFYFLF